MARLERVGARTVGAVLTGQAERGEGSPWLVSESASMSSREVEEQARALAASLQGLGVEQGDRIALVLNTCVEFAVAFFAAAKIGAIVVPLNPRQAVPELQYMLRHSQAVGAVTIEQDGDSDFLQLFEEIMPQLPELRFLVTVGEEDLWYDDRIFQYEDLVSAGEGRAVAPVEISPDDRLALLYTSGTSGKPKGVELSHDNLLYTASSTAEAIGLTSKDSIVGISAFFHVFGLAPGLLGSLLTNAQLILVPELTPEEVLRAVETHGATVHFGTPTLFLSELDHLKKRGEAPTSLRLAVVSGAPVNDELVESLAETLDVIALAGYSVTETASTVSTAVPCDQAGKRRFTVGRPLPGTEVRVVEMGQAGEVDLPEESVGEIRVRGPGVMVGYYRQPKLTAESLDQEGYYKTGDLGLLDEDGYLHLVGRTRDVIIRSGLNVYPREVETRIEAHPAVQEAAAVGVTDELLGEAICACVVPVEGAIVTDREIVDWCREVLVAEKVPDLVRFLDELPRTDTGQVRRVELSRAL